MANLKSVAQAAGVSVTTVSRYLNGSLDLPARTSDQIEAAIRSLNYMPNPHARRLSLGRTDTIALVVPDIATPFFATFVAAVEAEADRRGLTLALHATLNRPDRELRYLDALSHGHSDGLIFVTNHPGDATLVERINRARRCIVVDEDVAGTTVPKLFCDNLQGGHLAGLHLAAAGHRDVLFLGGVDQMVSGMGRHRGFLRGMTEGGGPGVRVRRIAGPYTVEAGRAAAQDWLAMVPRPTAIFATSDELAIGLLDGLRAAQITIPDEVSVVGFDDVGPLHLFAPAVTAVRQPVRQLGVRALEILLGTDWTDPGMLPQEELLPVTLVARNSVAPPARGA